MKINLKRIFSIAMILLSFSAFGQETVENQTYDFVQEMPEFPGGQDSLHSFLKQNLVYPDSALDNGIQGRVYIGFIVEKDGSISEIKTVGSKIIGYGLEEESLRVVNMMPNWMPGKQNAELVRVKFTLPISFKLFK